MRDVDNSEDTLDSRDVESRIDDLDGERGYLENAVEEAQDAYDNFLNDRDDGDGETAAESAEGEEIADALAFARKALADWDASDEAEELKTLKAFRDELQDYCPDWLHGTTLIRDSYWVEYVQEMLEDIGELPKGLPSYIAIDWNKTANAVQIDYTSGEFDGVTYWAR